VKIKRVEHIAIAVNDMEKEGQALEHIFGQKKIMMSKLVKHG